VQFALSRHIKISIRAYQEISSEPDTLDAMAALDADVNPRAAAAAGMTGIVTDRCALL